MVIYILILLIFLFMFLTSRNTSSGRKSAIFSVVILILLAGFKFRVGSDALLYQDIYEQYPTIHQLDKNYVTESRWGPIFVVWFSFCHTLFHDFIYYQFIHATILLTSVYFLIRRYTELLMPAILMFSVVLYFFMTFDLYREGLAAAIYFFSVPFLEKKKYVIYYTLCLICFNIHTSSFLCFLVPIFYKLNLSNGSWKLLAICFIMAFILPSIIIPTVNLIPVDSVRSLAMIYLSRGIEVEGMTLPRTIFVIVVYYFAIHKNLKYATPHNKLVLNLAYISLLIETLQKAVPFIFRLNSYFSIFLRIALSVSIERILTDFKYDSLRKYALTLLITLVFCSPKLSDYIKNQGTYNAYFPYVSIFDPHTISKREFHSATDYLFYDR